MKITPARIIACLLLVLLVGLGWSVSAIKRARFVNLKGSLMVTLPTPAGYSHVIAAEWLETPPIFTSEKVAPERSRVETELTAVANDSGLEVSLPVVVLEQYQILRLRWVPDADFDFPLRNIQPHIGEWWLGEKQKYHEQIVEDRRLKEPLVDARLKVWNRSGRTVWLKVEDLFDPPGTFAARAKAFRRYAEQIEQLAAALSLPPRPRPDPWIVPLQPVDLERWISNPAAILIPPPIADEPRLEGSLPEELSPILDSLSLPHGSWQISLGPRQKRVRIQRTGASGRFVRLHPRETLSDRLESAAVELTQEWGTAAERAAIDRSLDDLSHSLDFERTAFVLEPAPLSLTLQTLETLKRAAQQTRVSAPSRLVITTDPRRPTGWVAQEKNPQHPKSLHELVIQYAPDQQELRFWLTGPQHSPQPLGSGTQR